MNVLTGVLLVAVVFETAHSASLPKTWTKCKKDDPSTNECLDGAITHAVSSLLGGNPKLGVLPMEPLHFNSLTVDQGTGPVAINLSFSHVDLSGIASFMFVRTKANWKEHKLNLHVIANNPVSLAGDYKIQGKVLVLPITGDGKCNLTFTGLEADIELKGHEETRDGKSYLEVDKMDVFLFPKHFHIYFGNLFNGDKALGDNMNVFLNENWKEILEELRPAISRAFGEAFRQIANRLFTKVPFNRLFL